MTIVSTQFLMQSSIFLLRAPEFRKNHGRMDGFAAHLPPSSVSFLTMLAPIRTDYFDAELGNIGDN